MKLPRRTLLHLAAGAAALPAVSRVARAQDYPTRPVRIIVGYPTFSRHVPYRGAQPALTDLISGQVQVMFVASTVEYIKTGKVRALAVTTPTRSEVLPDVPPLSEFVPGYDAAAWIGVGAPKNTPLRSSTN
jgi:tripartite-type tricarboxylate transporter receptor subunit TctC